jgi:hypothetical protein
VHLACQVKLEAVHAKTLGHRRTFLTVHMPMLLNAGWSYHSPRLKSPKRFHFQFQFRCQFC